MYKRNRAPAPVPSAQDTTVVKVSSEMAGSLKFAVIVGSVREGRIGERIMKLFINNSQKYKDQGYTFEVIDAKEFDLPVLKRPLHHYQDRSQAPDILHKMNDIVEGCDGYFVLSAEYNRLPCPGLLNLIDHMPVRSFCSKPCGIITYSMGAYAGCSAAAALPNYICELGSIPVRQMVRIPNAHKAVAEDGSTEDAHIISSIDKQMKQVAWFADACKTKREKDGQLEI